MSILLIGQGRLGLHLNVYFDQANIPVVTWNRKFQNLESLKEKLNNATHILLAISDSDIEKFYREYAPSFRSKTWVHFSGALEIPGVHSLHPLMTFGPMLYSLEKYRAIPFVSTSSKELSELIPGLENPFFKIKVDFKMKYHALCVLSGNFTTILWQKFIDEFKRQGLPDELGRIFAEQTVKNVFDFPQTALTGPLARQDRRVQKLNLEALQGDRFAEVYQAFQFAYAEFIEKRKS
jgi:2-dehydropantoate 2-reductase